jgi:hypothetical protein
VRQWVLSFPFQSSPDVPLKTGCLDNPTIGGYRNLQAVDLGLHAVAIKSRDISGNVRRMHFKLNIASSGLSKMKIRNESDDAMPQRKSY